MQFRQHKVSGRVRSGFSFIEFISCIAALGGGLALGLVYLGFDLEAVAVSTLEYVELSSFANAETIPEEDAEHVDEPVEVNAEAKPNAKRRSGLYAQANSSEPEHKPVTTPHVEDPKSRKEISGPSEVTDPEIATQAYWTALTTCMQEERSQRESIVSRSSDWQLYDYLNHRKISHEKAVSALEIIEETNVDRKLCMHAQQVLSWHRSGVQLYGRAVELLTDSSTASFEGFSAQSWQSAATQHRMEEKLVRGKHISMAGYLNSTYHNQAPFKPAVLP